MLIIDCDTHFGVLPYAADDLSVDRLIAIEKSESIDYVLSYSITGRAYDMCQGNDTTLEASRTHPELLPVAVIDPRPFYGVEEEIERAAGLGFVAVRVFPEGQGWSLDSLLFSRIVQGCSRHNLPLMVSVDSASKASHVVQTAADTTNPIILMGANYAAQGEALAAASFRDNTYVCTRFFCTPGAYEEAASGLGADRLVFGTDAPASGNRESLSVLMRSGLSQEQKAGVLGGNMARIMAGQLARLGRTLSDTSGLREYERKCVKTPIIDVHGHLGPWPFPMRYDDARGLAAMAGRLGVEKSIISSTNAIVNDMIAGNAELDAAIDGVDGLYGYVTVNPNYLRESIEEMRKYLDKPKFVGLKMHPGYARATIDGEAVRALTQIIACRPVPFLIHTLGAGEPGKIRKLAREFPEVPIIMAHGGGAAWREAVEVVMDTGNTYIEFCASTCPYGKVREAIDEMGTDRMLFGTDLGLFDPAYNLGTYESADLTPAEQEAIMHANARKLFRFG